MICKIGGHFSHFDILCVYLNDYKYQGGSSIENIDFIWFHDAMFLLFRRTSNVKGLLYKRRHYQFIN